MAYRGMFGVSVICGAIVLYSVFAILGFMGIGLYSFGIVASIVTTIFLITGIIVSLALSRFILKIWNWQYGELTLDDEKQSILDFGT